MGFSKNPILKKQEDYQKKQEICLKKQKNFQEKSPDPFLLKESSIWGIHNDNIHSVFPLSTSTNLDPTKNLAARFSAWKCLLKELVVYFKAVISIQETKIGEFRKLENLLNVSFSEDNFFFQDGGVKEVEKVFCEWNQKYATQLSVVLDSMSSDIILRLEKTIIMLKESIKNILKMSVRFRNNLSKEADASKKLLEIYKKSLLNWEFSSEKIIPKADPYILRLSLERQIEKMLSEENMLLEAYLDIQSYCCNVEKQVIDTVQQVFGQYRGILQGEIAVMSDFDNNIGTTGASISLSKGWNRFISEDFVFKFLIED